MLRILGPPYQHCDGIARRQFLAAGALGIGGFSLVDLLRAEAAQGIGSSHKAIINIQIDRIQLRRTAIEVDVNDRFLRRTPALGPEHFGQAQTRETDRACLHETASRLAVAVAKRMTGDFQHRTEHEARSRALAVSARRSA